MARNSRTAIGHANFHSIFIVMDAGENVDFTFGGRFSEFHAVFNQVDEYLNQNLSIIIKRTDGFQIKL